MSLLYRIETSDLPIKMQNNISKFMQRKMETALFISDLDPETAFILIHGFPDKYMMLENMRWTAENLLDLFLEIRKTKKEAKKITNLKLIACYIGYFEPITKEGMTISSTCDIEDIVMLKYGYNFSTNTSIPDKTHLVFGTLENMIKQWPAEKEILTEQYLEAKKQTDEYLKLIS
jgi:hypothetical protein